MQASGGRGCAGHGYFPQQDIPTWTAYIDLLREQRDRHLRRAAAALYRMQTELEAALGISEVERFDPTAGWRVRPDDPAAAATVPDMTTTASE